MIAYDVKCENGHIFEGWFKDGASFEDQKKGGMIGCPHCGETRVERIPSTFAIGGRQKREEGSQALPPQVAQFMQLQRYIKSHFEDVGGRFAEEAIKIHYGEIEKKNIRGTTTDQEEQELREEGVPFIKIPIVPQDS
jgi:hypothetical protein